MQQSLEHFDLAIVWGDGYWPSMEAITFINIQRTPFLSPQLKHSLQAFDLLDYPLIHQRDRRGWQQQFSAAEVVTKKEGPGTVIDDAILVLQTALNRQGVALGILPFIEEELANGKLLRPFELAVDPRQANYLIQRRSSLDKPTVRLLRDWLVSRIDQMPPT